MSEQLTYAPQQDNHEPANAEKNSPQVTTPASIYYPPHGLSLSSPSSPDDIPLTRNNLLFLQRTVGNHQVMRLLQRKAKLSQAGDAFEREADRVAEQVVQMPSPASVERKADTPQLSRKPLGGKCPECQRKLEHQPIHEAEGRKRPEEESAVQMKAVGVADIERKQCKHCDEERLIQAKEESGQTPEISPKAESQINSLQGGGEPLSESVRADFEPRFGVDFSDVRVHKGSQAAESAQTINARAYTTGRDIVFGANEYAPESSQGKRLLAHELTHVAQQEVAGNTTIQRQTDPEPVGLPPEHQGNLAAIEEAEESLKPQREERADRQRELDQFQMSSSDPKEEEELRAREKEIRERLSQIEKDLADGLQKKIGLIDTAISHIERVLPGQSGGGAPEVEQEVWVELNRLREMKKAAEKELLLISRTQKRELIRVLNEAIKELPEGSPE